MASKHHLPSSLAHAHPSPKRKALPSFWLHPEQACFRSVDVELRGLVGDDRREASHVFCPSVRRSPITFGQPVQHLDVVSCWKGLTTQQASEIMFWEGVFKLSLEKLLCRELLEGFNDELQHNQCNRNVHDANSLLSDLMEFVICRERWSFRIDTYRLICLMMDMYYGDQINLKHDWFLNTGDFPTAICNFLRTRDCFKDGIWWKSQMEVRFSSSRKEHGLSIVGEPEWYHPSIDFRDLPIRLHRGAEYRILPHHTPTVLDDSYSSYSTNTVYLVSSSHLPIAWDQKVQGFRAIVPEVKRDQREKIPSRHSLLFDVVNGVRRKKLIAETMFTARIAVSFPGDVRFEQTSRYNIQLEVKPKPDRPAESSSPLYATLPRRLSKNPAMHIVGREPTQRDQEDLGSLCVDPMRIGVVLSSEGFKRRQKGKYGKGSHTVAAASSWLRSYTTASASKRGGSPASKKLPVIYQAPSDPPYGGSDLLLPESLLSMNGTNVSEAKGKLDNTWKIHLTVNDVPSKEQQCLPAMSLQSAPPEADSNQNTSVEYVKPVFSLSGRRDSYELYRDEKLREPGTTAESASKADGVPEDPNDQTIYREDDGPGIPNKMARAEQQNPGSGDRKFSQATSQSKHEFDDSSSTSSLSLSSVIHNESSRVPTVSSEPRHRADSAGSFSNANAGEDKYANNYFGPLLWAETRTDMTGYVQAPSSSSFPGSASSLHEVQSETSTLRRDSESHTECGDELPVVSAYPNCVRPGQPTAEKDAVPASSFAFDKAITDFPFTWCSNSNEANVPANPENGYLTPAPSEDDFSALWKSQSDSAHPEPGSHTSTKRQDEQTCPTEENPEPHPFMVSQSEIQENYKAFLQQKASGESVRSVSMGEVKEFEMVFLDGTVESDQDCLDETEISDDAGLVGSSNSDCE